MADGRTVLSKGKDFYIKNMSCSLPCSNILLSTLLVNSTSEVQFSLHLQTNKEQKLLPKNPKIG